MAKLPHNIDGEVWRDVPGFDGTVQASSLGRIRRIHIYQLTPADGYLRVSPPNRGKKVGINAHRLVCMAFHGPPPEGTEVGHLNGVRHDNRPDNLKWVTCKENASHRVLHGTQHFGERSSRAVLTERIALDIKTRRPAMAERRQLAEQHGVTVWAITAIIQGKSWKHL